MDFHFSVMEKSWKVIVEKEWAPCQKHMFVAGGFQPLPFS